MQSIGSIQFLTAKTLFPFYWPLDLITNLEHAKLAVYLAVAATIFASVYGLAREISAPRVTALIAGWLMSVLATPFVSQPFFYAILWVAPACVLLVMIPPLVFALTRRIGRSSTATDCLCGIGLLGLATYLLTATPASSLLIGLGVIPYTCYALGLVRSRSELYRKLLVLFGIVGIGLLAQWHSYMFGLFSYTAAYLFPQDFSVVYNDAIYVSILFQGAAIGWAGPALVVAAVIGAAISWRSDSDVLRVGARILIAVVGGLVGLRVVFAYVTHWILPPPVYIEIAFWPLYATFAAVAVSELLRKGRAALPRAQIPFGSVAAEIKILPIMAIGALLLTELRPPTILSYPFPPSTTAIVDELQRRTSIRDGAPFGGRVATILPIASDEGDPWAQQIGKAWQVAVETGNDHFSHGLWWYQIPTLFEYNPFSSPAMHAFTKRTLRSNVTPHPRSVTIYTRLNARILKLLGVRYVIAPDSLTQIGEPLQTIRLSKESWWLSELPDANLATYTPTIIERRPDIASMIDFVEGDDFDPKTVVVVADNIAGPLVSATQTKLSFEGGDLRLTGTSNGRTLIVVPHEYSHCIEMRTTGSAPVSSRVSMHRVDGILTGVLFEKEVDIVLSFRIGPLHNVRCRLDDYRDFDASF